MSSIILAGAKTFGSALVKTAGNIALSYANQAINNLFYDNSREGPRLQTFHIQSSRDGAPMARVYGKVRLAGQIIWAARLKELTSETSGGGKGGGPTTQEYSYTLSFAIGLCEGEILGVDRIWANGAPLDISGFSMRVYKGTKNQDVDPLIAEIEGGAVPAFRETAYIVFEDMPLEGFGNRLPQLNFEVTRIPDRADESPRMEDLVKSINLIPGTGEFAYHSTLVERRIGPGQTVPENQNNFRGQADIDTALDQLQTELPSCDNVTLIVSWFGDDLRAGHCQVRPGVENREKVTMPYEWRAGGQTRASAYEISKIDGRAVYGGTPSDRSIVEAIHNLNARGLSVCLHPFLLMDIPSGNTKPNPYGGTSQPPFPWRGRITCDPAAGVTGSVDKTMAAQTQVDAFFGTCQASDFQVLDGEVVYSGPDEHSYRRMVLHLAYIGKLAGGVQRFLIGSELRGLTSVRADSGGSYPAVSALMALAGDVKTVLGPEVEISYAADWSEYFGHHPDDGSQDVRFHLDPLWAHPAISSVGIDAYIPLSDWRDGMSHLDGLQYEDIYALDYLQSNIEGGEGYDWYYASANDRDLQIRTPISDGLAGKPWVFRYKDFYNWWSNPHFDRVSGVEQSVASPWVPMSKPIWFCEIGCPAIDKGANQPNVFYDPKSSESFVPYYSDAARNDLIQRRYIEAFLAYFNDAAHNPVSATYNDKMIDTSASSIWCWDARPFPDFPARLQTWADGENWATGHWLNGRIGLVPLADIIKEVVQASSQGQVDVDAVFGMVSGFMVERPMTARAALSSLLDLYGVDMIETANGLKFMTRRAVAQAELQIAQLSIQDEDSPIQYIREDENKRPVDVRIGFIDQQHDYQGGSVLARNDFVTTSHIVDMNSPVVLDQTRARYMASQHLAQLHAGQEGIELALPPAQLALECADIITLEGYNGLWQIVETDGRTRRNLRVKRIDTDGDILVPTGTDPIPPIPPSPPPWVSPPSPHILDLPNILRQISREGPLVGVELSPFSPTTAHVPSGLYANLIRSVHVGHTLSEFREGPLGVFDFQTLDIELNGAALSSYPDQQFLNGNNLFALQSGSGFEVFSAQYADLIGPGQYRLHKFVRAMEGTDHHMAETLSAGAALYLLVRGWQSPAISPTFRDADLQIEFRTQGRDQAEHAEIYYRGEHLRPVSPVHLRAHISGEFLHLSWIRRSRYGGDDWNAPEIPLGEKEELYKIEILLNDSVVLSTETSAQQTSLALTALEPILGIGFQSVDFRVSQFSQAFGYGTANRAQISL